MLVLGYVRVRKSLNGPTGLETPAWALNRIKHPPSFLDFNKKRVEFEWAQSIDQPFFF